MAITLTSEPQSTPLDSTAATDPKGVPVPVSDCFKWCMQLDDADAVLTAGVLPTVTVTFPAIPTVPANGTEVKIWGRVFTVNNASNFTGTSFKVTTFGAFTAIYFSQMISANLFFARAVTVAVAQVATDWVVTITWNECREQSNFTGAGMDFTAITAAGGSGAYVNGVSPIYADGLRLVTQLGIATDATSDFSTISEFEGHEPDRLCDSVAPVCVNYADDIKGLLYTIFPPLGWETFTESVDNGRSLMRPFSIKYGWMYRDNCVSQSGTFMQSGFVVGINAAFDQSDVYGMRKYWANHPDGLPDGQDYIKYLTTQPYGIALCPTSYAWLWLTNNYSETVGASYKLRAVFTVYKNGVGIGTFTETINDSALDGNSWYQPVNFNVSPERIFDLIRPLDDFDYYEVQVIVTNAANVPIETGTERLRYSLLRGCGCNTTDVYFLTPVGGYGTIVMDIVTEQVVREGTEVNLYQPCEWSFEKRNQQGGRTLINLRNYKRLSLRAASIGNSQAERDWFTHFANSPIKYIRQIVDGVEVAVKVIIDPDTLDVYDNNGQLELTVNAYMPDMGIQNPSNQ